MSQKEDVKRLVAATAEETRKLAMDIWNYSELSFNEYKSCARYIELLRNEGFEIEEGIVDIPTAFKASFKVGNGKPVIGLLAEYDALDGLSQKAAQPVKECREDCNPAGHGCGHNLLGAACYSSAVAIKNYLLEHNMDGTVIFFGCPAEEGAGSKQFIARAGYFDDVDFAYTWHPDYMNEVSSRGSVAIMGANFVFDGVAAHAGSEPHLGRSALDAVELMNVGCNYLREHMLDQARIHYAYSDAGGTAPNVVQSHAVIKYEIRAPKVAQVKELFNRVVNVAKGAALMTETKMDYEITMAFSDYTPNKTLAPVMQEALEEMGAPEWTAEDYSLAQEFLRSYSRTVHVNMREKLLHYYAEEELDQILADTPLDSRVHPFNPNDSAYDSGSTDVGDVGYAAPTVMLRVATSCLGNVGHSWQNTAFSASEIGMKGMLRAAEVMTLATIRTLERPELIEKAKAELLKKNQGKYECPLPEYTLPPIGRY